MLQKSLLIAYGIVVAGLAAIVGQTAPDLGRTTLIAGLVVGALSVLWGIWILAGMRNKALPILTLVAGTFVFLSQAVMVWMPEATVKPPRLMAVLITLMLLLSLGTLMRLAYTATFSSGPSPDKKSAQADPARQG